VQRPTVLHLVRDWLPTSERFVADTLRTTTATSGLLVHRTLTPGGLPLPDPSRRIADPWDTRAARLRLAAVVLTHRGRLLHAHFGQAAPLAWRAARRLDRPFGVSLHGYDLLVAAKEDPTILHAVRAAQLVVVPSSFLADAAADRGVPDEVLRIIPSGLDLAELPYRERCARSDDSPITITFAGRFAPKKGVLIAAQAIERVAAQRPGRLRARFVGYGEQEHELRRLIAELDLPDASIVDGRIPGAVRAALAETDVLLTASRVSADGDAETLGLVNLEAQAMGVPVVTTRSGGIPEAVCPTSTVFAADGSPSALAEALNELLAQPES